MCVSNRLPGAEAVAHGPHLEDRGIWPSAKLPLQTEVSLPRSLTDTCKGDGCLHPNLGQEVLTPLPGVPQPCSTHIHKLHSIVGHPGENCTEPATSPPGRRPGVGTGSWLRAAPWSSAGSRETWSILVLAKSWPRASGTWSHPVQLSKPASVPRGTKRMQL